MIYILVGDDTKSKNEFIKELTLGREVLFVSNQENKLDLIMSYSSTINLFGELPVIVLDNFFKDTEVIFNVNELEIIKNSQTIFIFKEDKMLAIEQKKYKKYGDIQIFENKQVAITEKFNTFLITDAFAKKDKISAWTSYRKGIEEGVLPEAIAGVLFWKIKTMLLNGSRVFGKDELKRYSSEIVSIYHRAHRGEIDFSVGLEQFILSSLSSK